MWGLQTIRPLPLPVAPPAGPAGAVATIGSALALLPLAVMAVVLVFELPAVSGDAGTVPVRILGGWRAPIAIPLQLNGLAWLSSALVVIISTVSGIAALSHRQYGPHFFFFLMMLVAGMQTVVLTADLFTMFVGFEIVAIAAYVLIAYDRTDEGLLAAFKYLMLSSVGILFFLFGVFLVYRELGTLSLLEVAVQVRSSGIAEAPVIHLAVASLVVGIGVRTAFIPFHTWLPEAHAYAPHPISAVLSGVLIKVSFFAMVRVLGVFSGAYLMPLLMWIGGITAVAAVIWALSQSDAKRLLAYHSISQMGYVLAAFGAASALALPAAFLHAMNHAFFKSLLFLVVGTVIHMTGERNLYRITPIGRRAPLLAAVFFVGAASIAGIPPFNGFASKQIVLAAVGEASNGTAVRGVGVLLSIASIGTVASFLKLSRIALPGPRRDTSDAAAIGAPGRLIHIPVVLLALLCIAGGLFGREIVFFLISVLQPAAGAAASVPQTLFSVTKVPDTLLTVALGILLFFGVRTATGGRIAHRIRTATPDLGTVLVMFVFGLGLFAGLAYIS